MTDCSESSDHMFMKDFLPPNRISNRIGLHELIHAEKMKEELLKLAELLRYRA